MTTEKDEQTAVAQRDMSKKLNEDVSAVIHNFVGVWESYLNGITESPMITHKVLLETIIGVISSKLVSSLVAVEAMFGDKDYKDQVLSTLEECFEKERQEFFSDDLIQTAMSQMHDVLKEMEEEINQDDSTSGEDSGETKPTLH